MLCYWPVVTFVLVLGYSTGLPWSGRSQGKIDYHFIQGQGVFKSLFKVGESQGILS